MMSFDKIIKIDIKLGKTKLKYNNDVKIDDIGVGEKFVYYGYIYTKINKENFCISDDIYDNDFMRCLFDPNTPVVRPITIKKRRKIK